MCFSVHGDSSPMFRREAKRLPSAFACTIPFGQRTRKTPSAYAYTSFISDLVLAKLEAVSKHLGKPLPFARLLHSKISTGL